MSPMPLKLIRKETYLQARDPLRLIKGPWTQKVSKEIGRIKGNRGIYMKVGKGGVQDNIYNGQIACRNELEFQRLLKHHPI